ARPCPRSPICRPTRCATAWRAIRRMSRAAASSTPTPGASRPFASWARPWLRRCGAGATPSTPCTGRGPATRGSATARAPWRARPDLAQRHRSAMERDLVAHLERWSAERRAAPDRTLRFLLGVVVDEAYGPALAVEVRLTSTRLRDEPRTIAQLEQLLANE